MKYKKYIISVIALAIICIMSIIINSSTQRLPKQKILELRKQYPIYGKEIPDSLSMETPQLEEVAAVMESFVYAEVIGEEVTYSEYIPFGIPELDAKRAANGLDGIYDFYEYSLRVIEDTEGIYTKGEKISIISNEVFREYNPKLEDGMKVVVPVRKQDDDTVRHGYHVVGMYYVTDNGYAISAFDEVECTTLSRTYSGIKVDALLKELANLKWVILMLVKNWIIVKQVDTIT